MGRYAIGAAKALAMGGFLEPWSEAIGRSVHCVSFSRGAYEVIWGVEGAQPCD